MSDLQHDPGCSRSGPARRRPPQPVDRPDPGSAPAAHATAGVPR